LQAVEEAPLSHRMRNVSTMIHFLCCEVTATGSMWPHTAAFGNQSVQATGDHISPVNGSGPIAAGCGIPMSPTRGWSTTTGTGPQWALSAGCGFPTMNGHRQEFDGTRTGNTSDGHRFRHLNRSFLWLMNPEQRMSGLLWRPDNLFIGMRGDSGVMSLFDHRHQTAQAQSGTHLISGISNWQGTNKSR
jgi:hypothetical protein